jgi:hypothetical protein
MFPGKKNKPFKCRDGKKIKIEKHHHNHSPTTSILLKKTQG